MRRAAAAASCSVQHAVSRTWPEGAGSWQQEVDIEDVEKVEDVDKVDDVDVEKFVNQFTKRLRIDGV